MNHRHSALLVILAGLSSPSYSEVVMEVDDAAATLTGTWNASTSTPNWYGVGYVSAPVGSGGQTARFFSPKTIPTTGSWCVQARWAALSNRSAAAKYELYDGTTLRTTATVDQRVNGGAWRTLACGVALTAGKTSEARLLASSGAAGSVVIADGVRWVWDESSAQSLCINVSGGQGAGGGTYVGQGMSFPASGTCKPWSGFMKTATDVVGFTAGSGCTSSDGKVFTATLTTTNPSFFGPGTIVSDHIQLCTAGASNCPSGVSQFASSSYFGSTTAQTTSCTSAILSLPSVHN